MNDKLQNLIEKLVSHGDDRDELNLWRHIFSDMNAEEQQELLNNLQSELNELEKLKK